MGKSTGGNMPRRIISWICSNKEKAAVIGAAVILCVTIALICCPSPAIAAGTDADHGISWSVLADGTLKFSGDGEVVGANAVFLSDVDSPSADLPEWYAHRSRIKAIDIGSDVRHVGLDSFVNFTALETLTVRGEMTELDFECIRYDTPDGAETLRSIIVWGPEESSARVYAEYNSLEFRIF